MLAGLPQYQEMREKVRIVLGLLVFLTPFQFSLHLNMAQECMSIFEMQKLPAAASVEQVGHAKVFTEIRLTSSQSCATGTTAEGKPPKHLVEEMVPLLDSNEIRQVA